MSKHNRKKARRRKLARLRHRNDIPATPQAALTALADVLNSCEGLGVKVRLRYGIVVTHWGYVLQIADGKWVSRNLNFVPFSLETEADDDED